LDTLPIGHFRFAISDFLPVSAGGDRMFPCGADLVRTGS
jgi:hypothetical protein